MPFMGLKLASMWQSTDSVKTEYLNDGSAQRDQRSVSLLLCYWSDSDVRIRLSGKCLSPQACVTNVSGPDMRGHEDSESYFAVSTSCLVSGVMTNRWVLLLALTSYWWEFTTIHGHKHLRKLACKRTVCQNHILCHFCLLLIKGIWLQHAHQTQRLSLFGLLTHLFSGIKRYLTNMKYFYPFWPLI